MKSVKIFVNILRASWTHFNREFWVLTSCYLFSRTDVAKNWEKFLTRSFLKNTYAMSSLHTKSKLIKCLTIFSHLKTFSIFFSAAKTCKLTRRRRGWISVRFCCGSARRTPSPSRPGERWAAGTAPCVWLAADCLCLSPASIAMKTFSCLWLLVQSCSSSLTIFSHINLYRSSCHVNMPISRSRKYSGTFYNMLYCKSTQNWKNTTNSHFLHKCKK